MATIKLFNSAGAAREDLLDIIKDITPAYSPLMSLMASGATLSTAPTWGTYSSSASMAEWVDIEKDIEKPQPSRLKEWLEAHRKI